MMRVVIQTFWAKEVGTHTAWQKLGPSCGWVVITHKAPVRLTHPREAR